MTELLSFVANYRTLLGKSVLGLRVTDTDLKRLGALEHLLSEPPHLPSSRRRTSRAGVFFPGSIRIGAQIVSITVTDLSAGGLGILTPVPLRSGELSVIEVRDEESGFDYRMPARVAWTTTHGHAGLAFLGVPLELRPVTSHRTDARQCVI